LSSRHGTVTVNRRQRALYCVLELRHNACRDKNCHLRKMEAQQHSPKSVSRGQVRRIFRALIIWTTPLSLDIGFHLLLESAAQYLKHVIDYWYHLLSPSIDSLSYTRTTFSHATWLLLMPIPNSAITRHHQSATSTKKTPTRDQLASSLRSKNASSYCRSPWPLP